MLQGIELNKTFQGRGGWLSSASQPIVAVDQVSLELNPKETVGLVGESGSGKSTLGELLGDLQRPTSGQVCYHGQDIQSMDREAYANYRRNVQFVFQSPHTSMNPTYTIQHVLEEPLRKLTNFTERERIEKMEAMMEQVGLPVRYLSRYPRQLSGGQCQRVAIGRALLLNPEILICDECVSALDVSVQAQILNLLNQLQEIYGTTYLFISHDLAAVKYISDRVLVMQHGQVVESGPTEQVLTQPEHAYTKQLLHYHQLIH